MSSYDLPAFVQLLLLLISQLVTSLMSSVGKSCGDPTPHLRQLLPRMDTALGFYKVSSAQS